MGMKVNRFPDKIMLLGIMVFLPKEFKRNTVDGSTHDYRGLSIKRKV